MSTAHTSTLEELREHSLEQVLESVLREQEILTVRMPGGQDVVIRPKPALEPLPVLEGSVPEDWKDAIDVANFGDYQSIEAAAIPQQGDLVASGGARHGGRGRDQCQ